MQLFERSNSDANKPIVREVVNDKQFTTPTVIVFGGINIDDKVKANGIAKRVETMLGRHKCRDHDVRIYAAAYPWENDVKSTAINVHTARKTRNSNFFKNHPPEAVANEETVRDSIRAFVRHQLMPLIADNLREDSKGNLHGKRIDVMKAMKNFRNLNFVAHSFGTVILEQMGDILATDMRSVGYNQEEADEISKQVFALSMGDVAPVGHNHSSRFSTMHVVNVKDYVVSSHEPKNYNTTIAEKVLERRSSPDSTAMISIAPVKKHGKDKGKDNANRWIACCRQLPETARIGNGNNQQPDYSQHEFGSFALLGTAERLRPDISDRGPEEIERINTFCDKLDQQSVANTLLVPIMNASLLRNAVHNSVLNHKSRGFTEIPDLEQMLSCKNPQRLEYRTNCSKKHDPYSKLHIYAKGIGYYERICDAIHRDDIHLTSGTRYSRKDRGASL